MSTTSPRLLVLAVAAVMLTGCTARWPVGVALSDGGQPELLWACGEPIRTVELWHDDEMLWALDATPPLQVTSIEIGQTPVGMTETTPLTEALVADTEYQAVVGFVIEHDDGDRVEATDHVRFRPRELQPGQVRSAYTQEAQPIAEFERWSAETCGT